MFPEAFTLNLPCVPMSCSQCSVCSNPCQCCRAAMGADGHYGALQVCRGPDQPGL
jgi:hypothetical protein